MTGTSDVRMVSVSKHYRIAKDVGKYTDRLRYFIKLVIYEENFSVTSIPLAVLLCR
jgi:hypothetical protein